MFFLGIYSAEFNTFFKAFLSLNIFTLRNNLFRDLEHFDEFCTILFFCAYIILITIVGNFLQVLFSDTVRNVFLNNGQSIVPNQRVSYGEQAKSFCKYIWACGKTPTDIPGGQGDHNGDDDELHGNDLSKKLK